MSNLIISGNLSQVRDKLQRISEVVKNRKAMGFETLQHDVEFLYIGERDLRECPVCRSFEHTVIRGDDIPRRFPYYQFLDDHHIRPMIHIQHPDLFGECRCILEISNVNEFTESRLHREKLAAV